MNAMDSAIIILTIGGATSGVALLFLSLIPFTRIRKKLIKNLEILVFASLIGIIALLYLGSYMFTSTKEDLHEMHEELRSIIDTDREQLEAMATQETTEEADTTETKAAIDDATPVSIKYDDEEKSSTTTITVADMKDNGKYNTMLSIANEYLDDQRSGFSGGSIRAAVDNAFGDGTTTTWSSIAGKDIDNIPNVKLHRTLFDSYTVDGSAILQSFNVLCTVSYNENDACIYVNLKYYTSNAILVETDDEWFAAIQNGTFDPVNYRINQKQ